MFTMVYVDYTLVQNGKVVDVQNVEQVNPVYEGMEPYILAYVYYRHDLYVLKVLITTLVQNGNGVDVQNMEQVNPVYEGMGTYTHAYVYYGHDLYVAYYSSKKYEGSGCAEHGANQ